MDLGWFERRIDPYPPLRSGSYSRQVIPFLWQCAAGLRGWLLTLVVLNGLIGAFEALLFWMMGRLIDWMGQSAPQTFLTAAHTRLWVLSAILAASPLLIALAARVKYQALTPVFPMRLRWLFHRSMLGQSMSFFHDEFAGRISAKVMQTALAVRDAWIAVVDILVYVGVYLITVAAVVAAFDRWLLLPFLGWLLLYSLAMWYFVPRLGRVASDQADARSLMTGRVTDAYTNITTIKLFAHGNREADYARAAMQDFLVTARSQSRLVSNFEILNHTLNMLLVLATAAVAITLWIHGQLGLGAVAAASAMALRLSGISHWIMWEMAGLFENVGTVHDGINTVTRPVTVVDVPGARALHVSRGEIRFEHVRFGYGAGRRVIDDLSLTIAPGEKIGLVGRSGAGKSTLVNLLLRFYALDSGRILIDGQDIALATQESVRAQIGMVTQDTALLHRSVRDNIVYGRPDASEAQLRAAAERARAGEFIALLRDAHGRQGYDALVGERGVKLSGGQRQRIALARVMLKDAPILLLDEATSALDSEVEVAIQETLALLMRNKTVVAIAHRLSTIAAMDRLVVLDDGVIVEQGTHAQLLAARGLYARLWAHQSGGFLGEEAEERPPGRARA
ncbi:MAG: ABC transporter ATP-binding protein [Proteobacteria bacterium]|nr:ABC transporter ATP-binding protein [Pseudomonadota bacterium]